MQEMQSYAKRTQIKVEVQNLTGCFFQAWQEEISCVRNGFEVVRQKKVGTIFYSASVNQAHQLMQLRRRLNSTITKFQVKLSSLQIIPCFLLALNQYIKILKELLPANSCNIVLVCFSSQFVIEFVAIYVIIDLFTIFDAFCIGQDTRFSDEI